MRQFTVNGKVYESNEKGNRFFVTDEAAGIIRKRISEVAFLKAEEEWQAIANAELKARKEAEEKKDREAEDSFNGKKEEKPVKVSKPRRSKDVAFEMDTIIGHVTLTAKQVQFLKLLPKTSFWENGVESTLWCDCIADDIDWNPMSVGAMISTLREKKLAEVFKDTSRQGHPKAMTFTVVGQVVCEKLGLR